MWENPLGKLSEALAKDRLEERQEECDHEFGDWTETGQLTSHSHPDDDRMTIKYVLRRRCHKCGRPERMNWNIGTVEWDWHEPPEWLNLNGRVPKLSAAASYDPEDRGEEFTRDDE